MWSDYSLNIKEIKNSTKNTFKITQNTPDGIIKLELLESNTYTTMYKGYLYILSNGLISEISHIMWACLLRFTSEHWRSANYVHEQQQKKKLFMLITSVYGKSKEERDTELPCWSTVALGSYVHRKHAVSCYDTRIIWATVSSVAWFCSCCSYKQGRRVV